MAFVDISKIFEVVVQATSYPLTRFFLVCTLLPVFAFVQFVYSLPHLLRCFPQLFSASGWHRLAQAAEDFRKVEGRLSKEQLNGDYCFKGNQLLRVGQDEIAIKERARWYPNTEKMIVCGAKVNVVREMPTSGTALHQPIVLLHGNPSWSFMWRNIIPELTKAGHEVFAIDWIGHGLSDKPVSSRIITFELHLRTLSQLFSQYQIEDAYIVAHDWGGCVALCAIPSLIHQVSGLVLLNSFFPPRPTDISLSAYWLYLLWFQTTGLLGGYTPEQLVMRYMSPSASRDAIRGYVAPFHVGSGANPKAKSGVLRFAQIVPGFPDMVLFTLRNFFVWKIFEGWVGPERFSYLNGQAALAKTDSAVRKFWRKVKVGEKSGVKGINVLIAFGQDDPLLADFKELLQNEIGNELSSESAKPKSVWIDGAGHYPVEEKAEVIAKLIVDFIN